MNSDETTRSKIPKMALPWEIAMSSAENCILRSEQGRTTSSDFFTDRMGHVSCTFVPHTTCIVVVVAEALLMEANK
jgi:hypothetical protein